MSDSAVRCHRKFVLVLLNDRGGFEDFNLRCFPGNLHCFLFCFPFTSGTCMDVNEFHDEMPLDLLILFREFLRVMFGDRVFLSTFFVFSLVSSMFFLCRGLSLFYSF